MFWNLLNRKIHLRKVVRSTNQSIRKLNLQLLFVSIGIFVCTPRHGCDADPTLSGLFMVWVSSTHHHQNFIGLSYHISAIKLVEMRHCHRQHHQTNMQMRCAWFNLQCVVYITLFHTFNLWVFSCTLVFVVKADSFSTPLTCMCTDETCEGCSLKYVQRRYLFAPRYTFWMSWMFLILSELNKKSMIPEQFDTQFVCRNTNDIKSLVNC